MRLRRPPAEIPAFDEADLEIIRGLEQNASADNYLSWLEQLCAPHLGDRVLEIGAGHGDLTERIAPGRQVFATELSARSLQVLEERFADVPNVTVEALDFMSSDVDRRFDSIIMINVLEHIRNDAEALDRLRQLLVPGGRLVVYVPAFWLLYSDFDRQIGHFRRYRKPELVDLVESQGFVCDEARYVNSVGALGWFAYCRVLGRRASDQTTVSACDRYIIPAVRRIEARLKPPFGISLLCVGRAP